MSRREYDGSSPERVTAGDPGPSAAVLVICGSQVALFAAWVLWLVLTNGPTDSNVIADLDMWSFLAGLPFWVVMAGLDLWFLRHAGAFDTWLIATGLIVSISSATLAGCTTAIFVLADLFPI